MKGEVALLLLLVWYVVGMSVAVSGLLLVLRQALKLKSMAEQCRPPENVAYDCDRREETLSA